VNLLNLDVSHDASASEDKVKTGVVDLCLEDL
jgi:hypothetical protein